MKLGVTNWVVISSRTKAAGLMLMNDLFQPGFHLGHLADIFKTEKVLSVGCVPGTLTLNRADKLKAGIGIYYTCRVR